VGIARVAVVILFLSFNYGVRAQTTYEFTPLTPCDQKIENQFYSICYAFPHRIAKYAVHWLSLKTMSGNQSRTNDYRRDNRVKEAVDARDYARTGFDRGHLVPAADMKINRMAMSESFFMTNMTPQRPGFNRGIWQSLERALRKRVSEKGSAYIVTAPLLDAGLPQLSKRISIPESFYKIAYFPKTREMIAYLIPNFSQKGRKISEFRVTVDELEALTQIDFFSQLEDHLEDRLEAAL
jgi:endonuclease G